MRTRKSFSASQARDHAASTFRASWSRVTSQVVEGESQSKRLPSIQMMALSHSMRQSALVSPSSTNSLDGVLFALSSLIASRTRSLSLKNHIFSALGTLADSTRPETALDVEPQQVVLGQGEFADWWFSADAAMRSMPVVAV